MNNDKPSLLTVIHRKLAPVYLPAALLSAQPACAPLDENDTSIREIASSDSALTKTVGPDGGEIAGEAGGEYAGVKVVIPKGALKEDIEIKIVKVHNKDAYYAEGYEPGYDRPDAGDNMYEEESYEGEYPQDPEQDYEEDYEQEYEDEEYKDEDKKDYEVYEEDDKKLAKYLPEEAISAGPIYKLLPVGIKLDKPLIITVPYDSKVTKDNYRYEEDVLVWYRDKDGWRYEHQLDSTPKHVTFELGKTTEFTPGIKAPGVDDVVRFDFHPVFEQNIPCMAAYPDNPKRAPKIEAVVVRGEHNDKMIIRGRDFKPGLHFALFTLERSILDAYGERDPDFSGFGLSWFKTELEVTHHGRIHAVIRNVLLDKMFGFNPDVELEPTRSFHMGFWFDSPKDAVACGADPERTFPFNADQTAGPVAMTTVPDGKTLLGPLCAKPDTSVTPAVCKR